MSLKKKKKNERKKERRWRIRNLSGCQCKLLKCFLIFCVRVEFLDILCMCVCLFSSLITSSWCYSMIDVVVLILCVIKLLCISWILVVFYKMFLVSLLMNGTNIYCFWYTLLTMLSISFLCFLLWYNFNIDI